MTAEHLVSTARASDKNMVDTVLRHPAGHSRFISQPEWTAQVLREAAGETL